MTIKLASAIAALGKSKSLMITIAATFIGQAAAAYADTVTVTYTGTVTVVANANGGLPPASDGDTLVATYVFNLDDATVSDATDSDIGPNGGFYSGPYGSFVTASLTVNGVAAVLPAFTAGEIQSDTLVPEIGTVLFSEVTDNAVSDNGSNQLYSDVSSDNFSWSLVPPLTGVSYNPSADEGTIDLETPTQDLLGADASNVTVTVTASAPVPEPSTWAMMLIGLAGVGAFSYRRSRIGPSHAV